MYLTVRYGQSNPDPEIRERMAHKVEHELAPRYAQIPGFIRYYAVRIRPDYVMTVTVFADRAGADESNRVARAWVQENPDLFVGVAPFEVLAGEVELFYTREMFTNE
jgi:hypothetical protein